MKAGNSEYFKKTSSNNSSPVLFIVEISYPPKACAFVTFDKSISSYSISILVPFDGLAYISRPSSVHIVTASEITCDVAFSLTTNVSVINL